MATTKTSKPEWLGNVEPGAAFVPAPDTFAAPVDGWYAFGNEPPVRLAAGQSVSAAPSDSQARLSGWKTEANPWNVVVP